MTILVTGGTGTIGLRLVDTLAASRADIRVLARSPEKHRFPGGVGVLKGDLTDVDSVRAAMRGVSTLFLLNAVTPDELTQGLMALNLAMEAGVRSYVYLSVVRAEEFADVPHFAAKAAIERMIRQRCLSATILRPNYFMQNDLMLVEAIRHHGVYPMPFGEVGVSMVDVRDIADAAAGELLRRENSSLPLPAESFDLVGPDVITGPEAASVWQAILNRPVRYGGNDLAAWEESLRKFVPPWFAYDMVLMLRRFQTEGIEATRFHLNRMAVLLGRNPRRYRNFVAEVARDW